MKSILHLLLVAHGCGPRAHPVLSAQYGEEFQSANRSARGQAAVTLTLQRAVRRCNGGMPTSPPSSGRARGGRRACLRAVALAQSLPTASVVPHVRDLAAWLVLAGTWWSDDPAAAFDELPRVLESELGSLSAQTVFAVRRLQRPSGRLEVGSRALALVGSYPGARESTLRLLARIQEQAGLFDDAVVNRQQALVLWRRLLGEDSQVQVEELGRTLVWVDRYDLAIQCFEQSLALQEPGSPVGAETTRHRIARTLLLAGRLEDAELRYRELLRAELAASEPSAQREASYRIGLAEVLVLAGQQEEAEQQLQQVVAYGDALLESRLRQAQAMLGRLWLEEGELSRAERILEEAASGANGRDAFILQLDLAGVHIRGGQFGRARDRVAAARRVLPTLDHPILAETEARIHLLSRASARGTDRLSESIAIRTRELLRDWLTASPGQRRDGLGPLLAAQSKIVSVALREASNDPRSATIALNHILQLQGRGAEADVDVRALVGVNDDPEVQILLDTFRDATVDDRAASWKVWASADAPLSPNLGEAVFHLGHALASVSEPAARVLAPVDVAEVARRLPLDGQLLLFQTYRRWDPLTDRLEERRYARFTLMPDETVTLVDLGPVEAVDAAVDDLQDAIRHRRPVADAARALARLVLEESPSGGGSRWLAPAGRLGEVPFTLLENPRSPLRAPRLLVVGRGRDLLAAVASPVRPTTIPECPRVDSGERPRPTQALLGWDAPTWWWPSPPLSAEAVSRLASSGPHLGVVPPCRSGDARVDVSALRSSLSSAGVPVQLIAMWGPDDDAARTLLEAFHAALQSGMTPRDALARAQGVVAENERWGHPYYWARFVLSGPT